MTCVLPRILGHDCEGSRPPPPRHVRIGGEGGEGAEQSHIGKDGAKQGG